MELLFRESNALHFQGGGQRRADTLMQYKLI